MCGIDFVMAVTYKEAAKAERYVHFDERIHDYLLKKETGFSLLLNLEQYGRTTVLYSTEILELINICRALSEKYSTDAEISSFAQELGAFCEEAVKLRKHIYAIGD
ncbi:MAG: hypothetical protein ABGX20_02540 [Bacillus sp. (in: firmicutes)]